MTAMQTNHLQLQNGREISTEEIIQECSDLLGAIPQFVLPAMTLLMKWEKKVQDRSEDKVDVYGTGGVHEAPYKVFEVLQKTVDDKTQKIQMKWKRVTERLKKQVTCWNTLQLHQWVRRKPAMDCNDTPGLENLCETALAFLKNLLVTVTNDTFRKVDSMLREPTPALMSSLPRRVTPSPTSYSRAVSMWEETVSILLVIREQPPPVMVMMSATSKAPARNNNSAEDRKPQTTVGILGGQGFGRGVAITDVAIGLGLNTDLARSRPGTWDPKDLNMKTVYHTHGGNEKATYESTQKGLKLKHFKRNESTDVWQLLYHVVYFVNVVIQGLHQSLSPLQFQFKVLSFPVMVTTAASQAITHTGAHLWHTFSARNVYDLDNMIQPSLRVEEVIAMLNERLRSISVTRELRDYERRFLRDKLKRAVREKSRNGTQTDTITLETFLKTPVTLPQVPNTKMEFSVWRWVYSVINLLVFTLQQPWADGVIYGFASHEQCMEALAKQNEGTFLLRFSESILRDNHMLSQAFLSAVIRVKGNAVFAKEIDAEEIRMSGLAHKMMNNVCKRVLGCNISVQELMNRYPPADPVTPHYTEWTDPVFQDNGPSTPIVPLKGKRRLTDAAEQVSSTPRTTWNGSGPSSMSAGPSPLSGSQAASPLWHSTGDTRSPSSSMSAGPSLLSGSQAASPLWHSTGDTRSPFSSMSAGPSPLSGSLAARPLRHSARDTRSPFSSMSAGPSPLSGSLAARPLRHSARDTRSPSSSMSAGPSPLSGSLAASPLQHDAGNAVAASPMDCRPLSGVSAATAEKGSLLKSGIATPSPSSNTALNLPRLPAFQTDMEAETLRCRGAGVSGLAVNGPSNCGSASLETLRDQAAGVSSLAVNCPSNCGSASRETPRGVSSTEHAVSACSSNHPSPPATQQGPPIQDVWRHGGLPRHPQPGLAAGDEGGSGGGGDRGAASLALPTDLASTEDSVLEDLFSLMEGFSPDLASLGLPVQEVELDWSMIQDL
ncbi:uncharacterized protein LOC143289509 [Babylonia areolata]|uniref:uncharacterized protein LOC143289509 n=1 Tax=Babylonia areolata TaxID=304850 RepID=UPI003FD3FD60